jgi:hypothetical protein
MRKHRPTPCGDDVGAAAQVSVDIDVETCRACGGAAKVIACIEDAAVIKKIRKRPVNTFWTFNTGCV